MSRERAPSSRSEKAAMVRRHLADIFNAALTAVDPYHSVMNAVNRDGSKLFAGNGTYDLGRFARIIVAGAGKAAARMALAVEDLLAHALTDGLIIVKKDHTVRPGKIRQVEASHPIPDEAGVQGTRRIVEMLRLADEQTLVICPLSGGASALLVSPADGITLEDKQRATDLLLRSGAAIQEVNAVRKHLSSVKGGRLAQIAYPAPVLTLIMSDVIGDPLDVIASGPTVPDSTAFTDALAVVGRYGLRGKLPERVLSFLERGAAGREPETPKENDPCFLKTGNVIVAGLRQALAAARETAAGLGMTAEIMTSELQGEARGAARLLAEKAMSMGRSLHAGERQCLLAGGETTVTVKGSGVGGRNQELALAFALEIAGKEGITLLSAGTDGADGPTDAAGAIVDGRTVPRARALGMDPATYLENNDSYAFFTTYDSRSGEEAHFITGPTGTNVMDVQIIAVEGSGP